MAAHPFLCFPIRGKKDAIRARHRARQVASLLQFPVEEQACIAAGAFVVACQALARFRSFRLCFQIDARQLQVFAGAVSPSDRHLTGPGSQVASLPGLAGDALLRLEKPLPPAAPPCDADLGWLVEHLARLPGTLFDEIIKQNQEILSLMHELYASRKRSEGHTAQTNAA